MKQPLAAIDLGTNTARLLIGRTGADGLLEPLLLKRHITRLGGGFTREEGISADAQARTISALREFADDIRRFPVERTRAVATSAVRDAVNRKMFCDAILQETGICLEVIDGVEEGLLTLGGVVSGLDDSAGSFLVFDVGGGSTEYTVSHGAQLLYTRSLPLGVVRLTEGKRSPEAMSDKIARELELLAGDMARNNLFPLPDSITLVGTAGTATTLAAISLEMKDYDYRRVNNHVLSRMEIQRIYDLLLPLAPVQRLRVTGMEQGREDLIIAGTLLTMKTMDLFGSSRMKVSDFGLLEGVLRSMTAG